MTSGVRRERVAEQIKKYVAEVLVRHVSDPRLAGLMVTRVETVADLSIAKVFVRAMTERKFQATPKDVERAANHAVPLFSRGLGAVLGIKKTPALSFHYDTGQDAIDRVEELLGEIAREERERSE